MSIAVPKLEENARYKQITSELKRYHAELLQLEADGKLSQMTDSPLVGEYLTKLRLNCNLLFAFMNNYLDVLSDLQREYAEKKQGIYLNMIDAGKSPSAAETHAKESTRVDDAVVKAVENRISQTRNEYERFNGICMMLQSRLREFNTERIAG